MGLIYNCGCDYNSFPQLHVHMYNSGKYISFMNLYFLMGLETRQLDFERKAPLVSEEWQKKKEEVPQPRTDSDLFWTTEGENA